MQKLKYIIIALILSVFSCTDNVPEAPKSSAKEVISPSVPVPNATSSFDSGTNTYTYTVPANTNLKAIAFSFSLPAGATSVPASGSVQDFTNPVKYTITAEDGSKSVMTVVVQQLTANSNNSFSEPVIFVAGNNNYYCIDLKSSKVLWKTPIGVSSYSSPQFFDNKIALAGFGKVSMLNINNGQLIWQTQDIGPNYFETPKFFKTNLIFGRGTIRYFDIINGSTLYDEFNDCSTPLTIESNLLFYGGTNTKDGYSLYCFDLDKKVRVWKTETKSYLITGKPLIIGDNVLYKNIEGALFLLEKKTGNIKWKFIPELKKYSGSSNSSPILVGNSIISETGNKTLLSFDVNTGTLLWETKLSSSSRWRESTPIFISGKLYMISNKLITCIEANTGKIEWEVVINSSPDESPVYFNEYLYFAQSGKVFEFDLNSKKIRREIEYSDYTGSAIGIFQNGKMIINNRD